MYVDTLQDEDITSSTRDSTSVSHQQARNELFFWNGRFSHVPENFSFPKGSTLVAWQMWCCGDGRRKIIPFCNLGTCDMPTRDAKKRLSDMNFLCKNIQKLCEEKGVWRFNSPRMKIDESNEMFFHAEGALPFGNDVSQKGNCRRFRGAPW